MDHNEISMFMDAKVDLQDKRSEFIKKFSQWIRCQVKIEAVKCLPCFLRITLEPREDGHAETNFKVLINVPGVTITLASSRTKQYSYAVSWLQNRRNCYIYFALDTELIMTRHMKWIRKSIKNLELHRKLMLEERRSSMGVAVNSGLGPLPLLPCDFDETDDRWSKRVSEIYEEIFDESSRQDSQRASIASGIYEEMKAPFNNSYTFECINEEMFAIPSTPPPLPPLPPQRKRFNTYETEENGAACLSEEIPRSNTNPETEMAKKKKYKNVLENLFYGSALRSKRTVSVSDGSKEQISDDAAMKPKAKQFIREDVHCLNECIAPPSFLTSNAIPIYANDDAIASKRPNKPFRIDEALDKRNSKRNSFSSPDLSKINFIDTFDEQRVAEILNNSYSKCEELDLVTCTNLDETEFMSKGNYALPITAHLANAVRDNPFEDNNISQQIPSNFNFSACNNSAINLIAPLSSQPSKKTLKNKIIFDDLSGYCVMAPIVKKMSAIDNTPLPLPNKSNEIVRTLGSVSSGYSSSSHCSSSSSCTNAAKEPNPTKFESAQPSAIQEESVVYENMHGAEDTMSQRLLSEFTGNLYENLLTVKAAQELEQLPAANVSKFSTSTPTESPLADPIKSTNTAANAQIVEEESYYQTPRKSIISVDEKVPSYYPNTCDSSVKSRRRSYSPARVNNKNLTQQKTPSSNSEKCRSNTSTTPVLRHIVNTKMRHERKENIFITSPQTIIEQRRASKNDASISPTKSNNLKSGKTKKTSAHKISENVYAVKHCLKKATGSPSLCNNNVEIKNDIGGKNEQQIQSELLHLTVLQNIDFKFEDSSVNEMENMTTPKTSQHTMSSSEQQLTKNPIIKSNKKIRESSSCNQSPVAMSQSTMTNHENVGANEGQLTAGIKKFASLPRFKRFNLSPLRTRINNVLQRHQTPDL